MRQPSADDRRDRVVRLRLLPSILGGLSLVLLVALRLYAAIATVSAETPWDDRYYRQEALEEVDETDWPQALARVSLPNSRNFGLLLPVRQAFFTRTIGHHDWLVLGQKLGRLVGVSDPERLFQLTNSAMLLIQLVVVFLFARWATGTTTFAMLFASLYLMTPVVFGINRWVMTENFVVTGVLVGAFAACWLVARRPGEESVPRRLGRAAIASYAIALFATTREYAVPAMVAIVLCVLLALLLERRWGEALVYFAVLLPFALAVSEPVWVSLQIFFRKGGMVRSYFHPLDVWISYLFWHGLGPMMTLVLFVGLGALVWFAVRELVARSTRWSGLHLLLAGFAGLVAIYTWGLATSWVRIVRPLLMPLSVALVLLLIALRLLPAFRSWVRRPGAISLLALMVLASWGLFSYQLLFAFDGGRSYLYAPYGPEVFNYPFDMRPLLDAEDSHAEKPAAARRRVERQAEEALHEAIAELVAKPTAEARRQLRERVLREPYLPRVSLMEGELTLAAVRRDGWTYGDSPAAVVVGNPGAESHRPLLGLAVWAPSGDYPITVFVGDGESAQEYEFEHGGVRTVQLASVPTGGDRLFLVWSGTSWRINEGSRLLGVRLQAPVVAEADRQAELLARLSALGVRPDAAAREELIADLRRGEPMAGRTLGAKQVTVFNVTQDNWTTEAAPAAILVRNGDGAPLATELRLSSGAAGSPPLVVFVEDGGQTVEHPVNEQGLTRIQLPVVGARSEALFLLWTDRTWTAGAGDSRRLGVRLKTARIRRPRAQGTGSEER